jgi:hypothetical protein
MAVSTIVIPNRKYSFTLTVPPDPNKNINRILKRKDSYLPPETFEHANSDGMVLLSIPESEQAM